ncbi:neopullulanase [Lachnospiraceae bacterium KM106-2]|nr:neopullulanase [Lachnospiraceae bacterium KM106-2]
MQLQAILHIPLSNYAYAVDEETLVIRIRTAKDDVKECNLFYGDRVCMHEPIDVEEIKMSKIASDQLFDYYECKIEDCYRRVCYYFQLRDVNETIYYCGAGFSEEMKCHRTQYFQFPYIRREDIPDVPDWASDIIMYHIFPDSFASGRRMLTEEGKEITLANGLSSKSRLGGTLKGVLQNLDYLDDLGVNCIYLNPIFEASEYHKYDTINYYEIDPCIGTKEDLKELVKEVHKRGMHIILDGVFNHSGSGFFAFQDVLKNGEKSKYKDWFYQLSFPIEYKEIPNYETFAYVKEMPKLNTGNQEVIDYFCNVGAYWIREMDIDGWRLDVANEINHDFWRAFRKAVRAVKKSTFLIAEIWEDSEVWLQGDQFDSAMNYTFSYLCRDFFANQSITVADFDEKIHHMLLRYPRNISLVQMNLLDSHDVPRFLSYCGGDREKLKLAMFYLFMSAGIPSVFYGDERLIEGVTEPEYRRSMVWKGDEKVLSMTALCKTWIHIRKKYEALRKGVYHTLLTEDQKGIYIFERIYQKQKLIILLHNQRGEESLEIPAEYVGHLYDLVQDAVVTENCMNIGEMEGRVFLVI